MNTVRVRIKVKVSVGNKFQIRIRTRLGLGLGLRLGQRLQYSYDQPFTVGVQVADERSVFGAFFPLYG